MKLLPVQLTLSCLVFIFSLFSLFAHAETPELHAKNLEIEADKIYDPDKLSLDSIVSYEKKFSLDWKNVASIPLNRDNINEIETFLKNTNLNELNKLNALEKKSLGLILYKLGTYYTHFTHQPSLAIEKMELAKKLLTKPNELAWNLGHLAYAYEQKYCTLGQEKDKLTALNYANQVLSLYKNKTGHHVVAFAYCVQGLVENDSKNFPQAETHFQNALKIYGQLDKDKDNDVQATRAKNKLASIMLDHNSQNEEAMTQLQTIKKYWLSQQNIQQNPYAARNFLSLGHAYLKIGKAKDARDELEKTISIYQNVYGKNSDLLMKPYQFLSDAYKVLGDQKRAHDYQTKANKLDKKNLS